ncbi:MAG: hypothetical protein ACXQS2_04845, partial [Methermicoccaceae archaeon]
TSPSEQIAQVVEPRKPMHFFNSFNRRPHINEGIALVLFGVVVILTGVFLLGSTTLSMLFTLSGIGSVMLGIVAFFLSSGPMVHPSLMEAGMLSGLIPLNDLLRDLEIGGGFHTPSSMTEKPFVICPITDDFNLEKLPKTPLGSFLIGENVKECAIMLEPPASSLLEGIPMDVTGRGADAGFNLIREIMIDVFEMANAVDSRWDGVEATIRLHSTYLPTLCESLHSKIPFLCSTVGCPICSLAMVVLSESTGAPFTKHKCTRSKEDITFHLVPYAGVSTDNI